MAANSGRNIQLICVNSEVVFWPRKPEFLICCKHKGGGGWLTLRIFPFCLPSFFICDFFGVMLCLVSLVTLLLPFLLFPLILFICLSVYVFLSFFLTPCCLSIVYFSPLVTFMIYLFAFVNLLICLFSLYTLSCVYFLLSQFVYCLYV